MGIAKYIAFRIIFVMMSKHSKFGVDIFINAFWVMGYIKIDYTFDKNC